MQADYQHTEQFRMATTMNKYDFADVSSGEESDIADKQANPELAVDQDNPLLSDEESVVDDDAVDDPLHVVPCDQTIKKRMAQKCYVQTAPDHRITRLQLSGYECTEMMKTLMEQMTSGMPIPTADRYDGLKDKELAAMHIVHAGWITGPASAPRWSPSHNVIVRRTDKFRRTEERYALKDLKLDQVYYLLSNIIGSEDKFLEQVDLMKRLDVERLDEWTSLQFLALEKTS